MITGQLKSKIDKLWEEFWTGGITNPLTVIEQITFLMYARLLDMNETSDEKKELRTKQPFKHRFNKDQQNIRWQNLKHIESADVLLSTIRDQLFPYFKSTAGENSLFAEFMKDAQLMVQKPSLLVKAVAMVDELPLDQGDTKGDLYEYLLSKLTTAGINGQFRTPRHIIRAMVEILNPTATDRICDPACGTAGFLSVAYEFMLQKYSSEAGTHSETIINEKGESETQTIYSGDLLAAHRQHVDTDMFHGFDFDATMLRIAAMNLVMHGVGEPDIHYQDTLSQKFTENHPFSANGGFDILLANPPFKGSLDEGDVAPDLLRVVKTKKTELLFVALILRMLKIGGRAAVIVPLGVLEGETSEHVKLRKYLLNNNQLEAVISLPHWTFKPYASVATAIIIFTKGGLTDNVWFYRLENDGFLDSAKKEPIDGSEIPSLLSNFSSRFEPTYQEERRKHRFVSLTEIYENDIDLCPNIYLRNYKYPENIELARLGDLFTITKGNIGAADAEEIGYPFVTSSIKTKKYSSFSFDSAAICIPLVSSTGHGHASINNIHYIEGKFEAASIMAVLISKTANEEVVRYVFAYLTTHKDDILVPYMKGAANVSLSIARLEKIKIPIPSPSKMKEISDSFFLVKNEVSELEEKLKEAESRYKDIYKLVRSLI